jgi:endonuclease/exonuclease/phosphatase family metal-dependent hydrolase
MPGRSAPLLLAAALVAPACSGSSDPEPATGGAADGAPVEEADALGPDAARGEPLSLRVLVFNVLHDFPELRDIDARTAMVARFIDDEQPDVALLQEISQTPLMQNRVEALAEATGYEARWVAAAGVAGVFEEGPAILSRWPITASEEAGLPHAQVGGLAARAILGAAIATPGGEVHVFSTHLDDSDSDPQIIVDQTLAIHDFVVERASGRGALLGGVLNSTPAEDVMRFLRGEIELVGRAAASWTDAWLAANPADPGLTSPSDAPAQRIDYLYLVPVPAPAAVESCALALAEPEDGIRPSDHIGVLCDVTLPALD